MHTGAHANPNRKTMSHAHELPMVCELTSEVVAMIVGCPTSSSSAYGHEQTYDSWGGFAQVSRGGDFPAARQQQQRRHRETGHHVA